MSLTIDYVTMPPKSQEVSQIQHGEQVKYEHAQQDAATQMQNQVQQQHQQTVRRAKPENKEFKYGEKDRKGKGKKGSGRKGESQQEKEEEKKPDSRFGGSRFDMKI